ncbi:hypothetical protein [Sorangium sp. So ce385]|uniref:hypothetical protein n=1 Tax=Sorangium sp. So ce385 TaxID=3133308 RepID=UPI003F5CB18E
MALLDSVRDASAEGNAPLHLLLGLVSLARRLDRLLGAPAAATQPGLGATPATQPGLAATQPGSRAPGLGAPAAQPGSGAPGLGAPPPQPGSGAPPAPATQPGSVAGAPGLGAGAPAPQPGSVEPPPTGAAASPGGAATDARSDALIYLLLGAISVRRTLLAELDPLREVRREQARREEARREDRGAPEPATAGRGLRSLLR